MSKPQQENNSKAFRTLRGWIRGYETEEETYFAYSAALRIGGDNLDFDDISRVLRLSPTHSHRKGERHGPRSREWPKDLWTYSPPVPEDRELAENIDALWADIKHAKEYLCSLKKTATVDVFLGYRSNNGLSGFEVPHTCLAMFIELEIPFGVSVIIT